MVTYIKLGMRARECEIHSHNWKGNTWNITEYHRVSMDLRWLFFTSFDTNVRIFHVI